MFLGGSFRDRHKLGATLKVVRGPAGQDTGLGSKGLGVSV